MTCAESFAPKIAVPATITLLPARPKKTGFTETRVTHLRQHRRQLLQGSRPHLLQCFAQENEILALTL